METDIIYNHIDYDFPKYVVRSNGEVYSTISDKLIKPFKSRNGYHYIDINNKHNQKKRVAVHRLVAKVFLYDKYGPGLVINHKNGNKTDNRVENLEWCTYSYNNKHAYKIGVKKPSSPNLGKTGSLSKISKKVFQYDLDGKFIKEYGSYREASRETSVSHQIIGLCVRGVFKQGGGYIWRKSKPTPKAY